MLLTGRFMLVVDPRKQAFWEPRSELLPDAVQVRKLAVQDVDELFARGSVRLLVKDKNRGSRLLESGHSQEFWQSHARLHTISPRQSYVASSAMPSEMAYRASEWYDGDPSVLVLLEIIR